MTFGELLSSLLKEKGISQNQLARLSGLPSAHINQIVNGKVKWPSIENAFAIADALEVDVNVFRSCIGGNE